MVISLVLRSEGGFWMQLDVAKMSAMTDRYHHGDLPNALRAAAVDVIAESGIGGFSLREVARRAGVSHNAPAHHFGDMTGLLTSLAVEGFVHLRDDTSAAIAASTTPPSVWPPSGTPTSTSSSSTPPTVR
jgi:AcrR family transcriptional regulator